MEQPVSVHHHLVNLCTLHRLCSSRIDLCSLLSTVLFFLSVQSMTNESESRWWWLNVYFPCRREMVEVKLCVGKLDGTTEYRRIAIPVLTQSTDVLSILRAKLSQLFPELTSDCNGIDVEFQYEGREDVQRESRARKKTCRMFR